MYNENLLLIHVLCYLKILKKGADVWLYQIYTGSDLFDVYVCI